MRAVALFALLVLVPLAALAGHGDAPPVFTQPLSFPSSAIRKAPSSGRNWRR